MVEFDEKYISDETKAFIKDEMDCKLVDKNEIDIVGIELNAVNYNNKMAAKIKDANFCLDMIDKLELSHQKQRLAGVCLRVEGLQYYSKNQRVFTDQVMLN